MHVGRGVDQPVEHDGHRAVDVSGGEGTPFFGSLGVHAHGHFGAAPVVVVVARVGDGPAFEGGFAAFFFHEVERQQFTLGLPGLSGYLGHFPVPGKHHVVGEHGPHFGVVEDGVGAGGVFEVNGQLVLRDRHKQVGQRRLGLGRIGGGVFGRIGFDGFFRPAQLRGQIAGGGRSRQCGGGLGFGGGGFAFGFGAGQVRSQGLQTRCHFVQFVHFGKLQLGRASQQPPHPVGVVNAGQFNQNPACTGQALHVGVGYAKLVYPRLNNPERPLDGSAYFFVQKPFHFGLRGLVVDAAPVGTGGKHAGQVSPRYNVFIVLHEQINKARLARLLLFHGAFQGFAELGVAGVAGQAT